MGKAIVTNMRRAVIDGTHLVIYHVPSANAFCLAYMPHLRLKGRAYFPTLAEANAAFDKMEAALIAARRAAK